MLDYKCSQKDYGNKKGNNKQRGQNVYSHRQRQPSSLGLDGQASSICHQGRGRGRSQCHLRSRWLQPRGLVCEGSLSLAGKPLGNGGLAPPPFFFSVFIFSLACGAGETLHGESLCFVCRVC